VKSGEALSKNWGIAKLPHPAGVAAGTSAASLTGISVNSNSKNKEAALAFAKYLTSPEGAEVLAKTGTIPAMMTPEVINAISTMSGFPTDANSKEALNVAQTYLEWPVYDKAADIQTVLNEAHDAIMFKNVTVDAGIKQMNDRVQAILSR
jgi:multiple sugar transport system substrate-binding protein